MKTLLNKFVIALVLVLIPASFFVGMKVERSGYWKTTVKETERQADRVNIAHKAEIKYVIKIREKIRYIRQTPDPTGCGTTNMPKSTVAILGGMFHKDSNKGQPGLNR